MKKQFLSITTALFLAAPVSAFANHSLNYDDSPLNIEGNFREKQKVEPTEEMEEENSDLKWWQNQLERNRKKLSNVKKTKRVVGKLSGVIENLNDESRDLFIEREQYNSLIQKYNQQAECFSKPDTAHCKNIVKKQRTGNIGETSISYVGSVRNTLLEFNDSFKGCYEIQLLAGTIKERGKINSILSILPNGSIDHIHFEKVGNYEGDIIDVSRCMAKIIRKIPFPTHNQKIVKIGQPFSFHFKESI